MLPLIALFTALVLAVRAWRSRTRPLGVTFLVLMLALAEWSLAAVMEYTSFELPAKVFWMKMTYPGVTAIPIAWLVFTLQYTDREKWLTRRNVAILTILPVITLVMVWTDDIHHLMWKDIWLDTSLYPPVDAVTHNTWFWVYATYAYSLLLLGTLCLFSLFQRSSGIYRKQVGIMLFAALVPWVGNFLFIAGIRPFTVVDPTPLSFAITGVAFFWGLSRLQLLDIMPVAHEAIFGSMVDGVIVLDTRHRIVDLNPAAQHIVARERPDAIGQPYSLVLPGQAGLLELKPEMTETQAVIALGEGQPQHYYGVYVSPIYTRQRLSGYLILLHDDTERRKAEVESRERVRLETELTERKRTAQVEAEAEAAKIANQAKSEFLASMSHELRTPLNAVIGFAQVLQEQYFGQLNEKQAECVNDILESGRHLLSLIDDILDLSKIEAGKEELELSMVNIRKLMEGSLVMIKEKALKHGISVDLQVTADIDGLEIRADERKVKQVMFNLLSNAAKFTPDGGAITVEGRKKAEEVIISVSDTGIGIAAEDQKRLFQRFYQVHSGTMGKTPGTGLGLAMAKHLTEMHGGKIWVESEGEGKGSRFSFTLPVEGRIAEKTIERTG